MPEKQSATLPKSKQKKTLAKEPEPGFDRERIPDPEADKGKNYQGNKENPENPAYQKKHPYSG